MDKGSLEAKKAAAVGQRGEARRGKREATVQRVTLSTDVLDGKQLAE